LLSIRVALGAQSKQVLSAALGRMPIMLESGSNDFQAGTREAVAAYPA
jgi:hypothetical protein